MKILKEREIDSDIEPVHRCPKCKNILEFECNEMKEIRFWKNLVNPFRDCTTGNAWFSCRRCNKEYLIKDYTQLNKTGG